MLALHTGLRLHCRFSAPKDSLIHCHSPAFRARLHKQNLPVAGSRMNSRADRAPDVWQTDRTHARSAHVRNAKCFVQIQVANVRAVIAGATKTALRVHVAPSCRPAAVRMHEVQISRMVGSNTPCVKDTYHQRREIARAGRFGGANRQDRYPFQTGDETTLNPASRAGGLVRVPKWDETQLAMCCRARVILGIARASEFNLRPALGCNEIAANPVNSLGCSDPRVSRRRRRGTCKVCLIPIRHRNQSGQRGDGRIQGRLGRLFERWGISILPICAQSGQHARDLGR